MTIQIQEALAALSAYHGKPVTIESVNDEQIMDLLTCLEHVAHAAGVQFGEYRAHINYLAEAGLCMGCAANPEVAATQEEEWDWTGCPGSLSGLHEFDDIDAASRKWIDAGQAAGFKVRGPHGKVYEA